MSSSSLAHGGSSTADAVPTHKTIRAPSATRGRSTANALFTLSPPLSAPATPADPTDRATIREVATNRVSLLLLEWHTQNVIGLLILLIVALLSFAGTGSGTSGSTPAPQSRHRYSQPRSTDPCRGAIPGNSSRSPAASRSRASCSRASASASGSVSLNPFSSSWAVAFRSRHAIA